MSIPVPHEHKAAVDRLATGDVSELTFCGVPIVFVDDLEGAPGPIVWKPFRVLRTQHEWRRMFATGKLRSCVSWRRYKRFLQHSGKLRSCLSWRRYKRFLQHSGWRLLESLPTERRPGVQSAPPTIYAGVAFWEWLGAALEIINDDTVST